MVLTHVVVAITFGLALSAWFRSRWVKEDHEALKAVLFDPEGRFRDWHSREQIKALEGRLRKVERNQDTGVVL